MREDLLILIIGNGRGGTSAVMGFLNLFDEINIGNEINQNKLSILKSIKLLPEFNGNKVVLSANKKSFFSLEKFVFCIEERVGIIHERFETLKPVFVFRDPIDNICSSLVRAKRSGKDKYSGVTVEFSVNNWIRNLKIINSLMEYFSDNFFCVNFYDFVSFKKYRVELLDWIGINYSYEDLDKKVLAGIYGIHSLNENNMMFGPKHYDNFHEERKEIEKLLIKNLGKNWRDVVSWRKR